MKNKISILIVEDEAISVLLLKDGLSAEGYDICAVAATGIDAVIAAEARNPDLVIMDVGLAGEMDGIEAARLIKDKTGAPVIFTTGYTGGELAACCEELKPLAFLTKPIEIDELTGIIRSAFGRSDEVKKNNENKND